MTGRGAAEPVPRAGALLRNIELHDRHLHSSLHDHDISARSRGNTQLPVFLGPRFWTIDVRMRGAVTLATIFGIKVRMHLTFPLLLIWVAAVQGTAGGGPAAIIGVFFVLLLFVCVVAHEFGHILVARHFGGHTRDILLLPIGGVSRMDRIPENPRQELAVALAGPAVSVAIGLVLVAIVGNPTAASIQGTSLSAVLPRLAAANLFLALFNLLPAFPMDGGRALRAALSIHLGRATATRLAAYLGHAFGVLFGTLGLIAGNPIILLIGIFIYFGATAEAAGTAIGEQARSLSVAEVMRTNISTLESNATLSDAVGIMLHQAQHVIPITESGRIVGAVTKDGVIRALDQFGRDSRLDRAMDPSIPLVFATQKLADAIVEMQSRAATALLVVNERSELVGMIGVETLADLVLMQAAPHRLLRPKTSDPRLTVSVPRAA